MIWEKIRGHAPLVELFRRSLSRRRIAHAWLFVGPAGVGKRLFARSLAQCLFCERFADEELEACGECANCRQMIAGAHPDLVAVGCPPGKNELTLDLFLGPKERRGKEGLCHDLSLRPMSARRKIALIDDAERMNAESANALLKTLEEPPLDSLLILIASNVDGLLPTIRSRCQQVRFAPLIRDDVRELLLEEELVETSAEAETLAGLCEGSLETARQLRDPGLWELRQRLYEGLSRKEIDGLGLAQAMVEGVENIAGDTAGQRRGAWWVVRFALEFYRQAILQLAGGGENPDTIEHTLALFERTAEAERQLDRPTPVPLCLETLFDDLARMRRRGTRA